MGLYVIITSQVLSEQHNQTSSYMTGRVSMQSGPLLEHYIIWVYLTMVVRRVHLTFISEFPIETHKLQGMPKPHDSTKEIGKTPAGEAGVL
jgi:hypothetical protein